MLCLVWVSLCPGAVSNVKSSRHTDVVPRHGPSTRLTSTRRTYVCSVIILFLLVSPAIFLCVCLSVFVCLSVYIPIYYLSPAIAICPEFQYQRQSHRCQEPNLLPPSLVWILACCLPCGVLSDFRLQLS